MRIKRKFEYNTEIQINECMHASRIMLESAYSLHNRSFADNISEVLMYAVVVRRKLPCLSVLQYDFQKEI